MSRLIHLLALVSVLAPLAVSIALYPELPERIPMHWNARGEVDGWAAKNLFTVFFPTVLSALVQLLMAMLSADLEFESGAADTVKRRYLLAALNGIQPMRVALAVMFLALTLNLPFAALQPPGIPPSWFTAIMFGSVIAILGSVLYLIVRMLAIQDEWEAGENGTAPWKDSRNWRWGVIYHNPQDPAFVVPKRFGMGFTFNFAHPRARKYPAVFVALLALPLLALFAG